MKEITMKTHFKCSCGAEATWEDTIPASVTYWKYTNESGVTQQEWVEMHKDCKGQKTFTNSSDTSTNNKNE